MNNIRILLVEDNLDIALRTEALIFALGYELLKTVDNSEDALLTIYKEQPDALVMDIDIKGKLNGIEVVQAIKDLQIPVIFITGHSDEEYYERARKTQPVAYLIKPINKFTFQTALESAIKSFATETDDKKEEWKEDVYIKDSFFIKQNNVLQKVKVEDIQYIHSDGNYCYIISNKKHAVKMSLTQILKKLSADRFIRIHQRYIIQTNLIENIDTSTNQIYVGGKSLPFGPKFKNDILRLVERL